MAASGDALSGDVPSSTVDSSRTKTKRPAGSSSSASGRDTGTADGGAGNPANASNGVSGDGCAPGTTGLALCSVTPGSVEAGSVGSSGLSITVAGSGFDGTSVVVFAGTDVPTHMVTPTTLTATVPPQLLQDVGTKTVTVRAMSGTTPAQSFNVTASTNASNDVGDDDDDDDSCGLDALSCDDLGISIGMCVELDDGSTVQCLSDGCVYLDCE